MESQCGFCGGTSYIDAVFSFELILKERQFNLKRNSLFFDYEKAFEQVNRPILFNTLHKSSILSLTFSFNKDGNVNKN
jgi:hypothetical protein